MRPCSTALSERAHDVILAHDVRERARAVGAIERGHGGSL